MTHDRGHLAQPLSSLSMRWGDGVQSSYVPTYPNHFMPAYPWNEPYRPFQPERFYITTTNTTTLVADAETKQKLDTLTALVEQLQEQVAALSGSPSAHEHAALELLLGVDPDDHDAMRRVMGAVKVLLGRE